ncbi:hypothetical protein [Pontiella sp.]|uniref:hypothetical protein n=1 Tax=Pontiella sp. TaxID=2837462 RepID=UPI0035623B5F
MKRDTLFCFGFSLMAACIGLPSGGFGASELTFDASGQPATLVLGDVDRFASQASAGFHLRYFDGTSVTDTLLTDLLVSGDEVSVSHPDGLPRFTFRIDAYDRHLAIHLIGVQGIAATDRNWGINLTLRANDTVRYFSLNDVAGNSYSSRYRAGSSIEMVWRYLWGSRYDGERGSFVLYDGTLTGDDLDAALAEIWSTQHAAGLMVRPAGQASWNPNDVRAWVEAYAAQNNDMSEVELEAGSQEELYRLTDSYVFSNHIKRVKLHTKTWRGEYWPNYNSRVHVNTNVFPAGKADLLAYSNHLRTNGVLLRLHSVSCVIGKNDPDYIVGGVDDRLASWGTGTLEKAVDASATTLRFVPDAGVSAPLLGMNIAHTGKRLYWNYFRLGNEIVKVGAFRRTDDDVWILENCTRGLGGTDSAAHGAADEMVGLHCSYNSNYIPAYDLDQTNSLMDELALEYAGFVNDLQLGHLHFDGPEIHDIYPWAIRDLFDRIYGYVDHPTTSSRVGGSISAHFEQQFSAVRDDLSYGYFPLEVGLRLEDLNRPKLATSLLDTHFHAEDGILLNGRRVTLSCPQSGYGVSADLLAAHGLSDEVLRIFQYWLELAPVLDAADVAYIESMTKRTSGSSHYESEDVLVLGTNATGRYIFTPHRIMGRTSGEDALYHIEQEWGAVPRFQAISAGTTMALYNPYGAQQPQVVIRVVETSTALHDPLITVNGTGTLSVTGDIEPGEYLKFAGGSSVNVYDNNWNFDRTLAATPTAFSVIGGTNTVTTAAGSGTGSPELNVQYITLGDVYVLESNSKL